MRRIIKPINWIVHGLVRTDDGGQVILNITHDVIKNAVEFCVENQIPFIATSYVGSVWTFECAATCMDIINVKINR